MRKTKALFLLIVIVTSSCSFDVQVLTPEPASTEVHMTPSATQVTETPIVATSTPTLVPVPPTLGASATDPIFFNGRAAATYDEQMGRQSSFPAGTKIVYVIWDYQNMRQGMQIRREWYLDGQPWLTRDETWDFAKYGSTGTMRDVSIHDEAAGLDSGRYSMRVYIDNILQPIGTTFYQPIWEWVGFEIGAPAEESFMGYGSPDGQWGVEVYGGTRIMLKNVITGEVRQIVIVQEVPYVTWFNDSKHFLFVDRDSSEQKKPLKVGIRDHLWIVDVITGDARRVFTGDNSFAGQWGPVPSPDGRYIASKFGSGFGDACFMDSQMIFFRVSPDFQSATFMYQQNFTGFPTFDGGWVYPLGDGYWEDESNFLITMDGTCTADQSKLGNFRFNLPDNTASQASASSGQLIPGNLGTGSVMDRSRTPAVCRSQMRPLPVNSILIRVQQHARGPLPPLQMGFMFSTTSISMTPI